MAYINYDILYAEGLSDSDYHILQKVLQRRTDLINDDMCTPFLEKGFFTKIKTGKREIDKIRISKKGKDFLTKVNMIENNKVIELADKLIDLYIIYDKNYGNKRQVIQNLNWFMGESGFLEEKVFESIQEMVISSNRWLENILWDKKAANLFTTYYSRNLSQSPLYEFMRRKYNLDY